MQSEANLPEHSCEAGTNLSATTVEFMFVGVTHVGFRSTGVYCGAGDEEERCEKGQDLCESHCTEGL